jgi:hypothetical protein
MNLKNLPPPTYKKTFITPLRGAIINVPIENSRKNGGDKENYSGPDDVGHKKKKSSYVMRSSIMDSERNHPNRHA